MLLVGCAQLPALSGGPSGSPAPAVAQASRGDAIAAARQCGRTLGIAVRCNLVRDEADFAVVRFAVLQGLGTRYGTVASGEELTQLVDLAALDRITSIGTCAIPAGDMTRVEAGVRGAIDACARP
jgi:hypothetical protein